MKSLIYVAVVVSLAFVFGCASEPASTVPTGVAKGAGTPGDQSKGDNVRAADAKVINDPSQAPASGGYRIEPKNPNDPKFKADPRLAGGG